MKKIITILSALTLSAMTYASISDNRNTTGVDAYADRYGGTLGIQNSMTFYTDSYVSYQYMGIGADNNGLRDLSTWGDITFSMYTIDANQNIISTFSIDSAMSSGTFSQLMLAGADKVGFAITNSEGKTIYSTPGINGSKTGTNVSTYMDRENGILYIGFFVEGYTQNDNAKADAIYAISVTSAASVNGQPLPGVLASLLIGAGALRLRRRK